MSLSVIDKMLDDLRSEISSTVARAALVGEGDPMTLAELVRVYRTQRRMSLQDVADASSMTKGHIWEIEAGRSRNPTVKAIHGLSVALGVPFLAVCNCALREMAP